MTKTPTTNYKTLGGGFILCLLLSGCFNDAATEIDLGSVSVGQQLIDLKKARDTNAISNSEYEESKAALLYLLKYSPEEEDFEHESADDDSDRSDRNSKDKRKDKKEGKKDAKEKADDDSGWLF